MVTLLKDSWVDWPSAAVGPLSGVVAPMMMGPAGIGG